MAEDQEPQKADDADKKGKSDPVVMIPSSPSSSCRCVSQSPAKKTSKKQSSKKKKKRSRSTSSSSSSSRSRRRRKKKAKRDGAADAARAAMERAARVAPLAQLGQAAVPVWLSRGANYGNDFVTGGQEGRGLPPPSSDL